MNMTESPEPLEPPQTYTIPVVFLAVACVLGVVEAYLMVFESRVEVNSLFILPGVFLLGIIGLIDPRVPASLQPGARGYPMKLRVIANACWVISILIGAVLYFGVFR